MTDLANLALRVDSTEVRTGVSELDRLTTAGTKAEGAVGRLGASSAQAGRQVRGAGAAATQMATQAQAAAARTTALGSTSQLAAHHVQNLAFQAQDLAIGLASGQRPMTVFLQQGAQIQGIMMQAGVGVRGLVAELLRMTGIIKVTSDATATADVAAARGAANAVRAVAARSAANITAADTELALALAAVRTATTSEALAAAQTRLAAAHQGVATAAAEATVAENALAAAEGRAASASSAASATRVTSLGRTGGALGVIAVAASAAFGAFKLFQSEVESSEDSSDRFARSLGLTRRELRELEDVGVTMGDVFRGLYRTLDDYIGLTSVFGTVKDFIVDAFTTILNVGKNAAALTYAAFVGGFRAIRATWSQLPSVIGDAAYSAANLAIEGINRLIAAAADRINSVIALANRIPGVNIGEVGSPRLGGIASPFAGSARSAATAAAGEFTGALQEAIDAIDAAGRRVRGNILGARNDRLSAQADEIMEGRRDRIGRSGGTERKRAEVDKLAEAYERALQAAQRFSEGLVEETRRIGLSAIETKRLEAETAALAAEKAAALAPTRAMAQVLEAEAAAIRQNFAAWEQRTRAAADADFERTIIAPLEQELALMGLVGPARERAALAMEEEAFKADALERGVTDVNAAWERYLSLQTQIIDQGSILEREREQAELLARELDRIIGAVGSLGGVGTAVGTLLGLASGNISSIGGPIGSILNITTGTRQDEQGRVIARTLGDELREIFKLNGQFGQTMSTLLQGAGTGLLAGNAFFGQQSTVGQLGSSIGGALGQALGEKVLTPVLNSVFQGLGNAAGPLGAIVGGLLGGLLPSLLGGTPRGSATIGGIGGELGITGTRGTSSARIAAASKSASAIIDSLSALADELGATLDPSRGSVSIGIRNGNFRVDTSGQGRTKTKRGAIDFGEDAEAAALFAIQDLIRDGVLVGLRAGTEALLKGAKDLETGVAKALKFEGVFKELAQLKDPLQFALDELSREFDRLRKIFVEAGATTEEYAQLEELLALKRQDALDSAAQREVDKQAERVDLEVRILQLLGREEEALVKARGQELAATKAALKPLQELVFQLEDARVIIDRFAPLADDLKAFRAELLGGGAAGGGFAFLRSQFRTTAGLAASGDVDALAKLRGTASAFLDAARDNASSALDYQRAVGEVLGSVDKGIFAADAQIEYAQLQIDAINKNYDAIVAMKQELATYQQQIAENTSYMARLWQRFEGDGLTIKADEDTPIFVKTAPGDTVATS